MQDLPLRHVYIPRFVLSYRQSICDRNCAMHQVNVDEATTQLPSLIDVPCVVEVVLIDDE